MSILETFKKIQIISATEFLERLKMGQIIENIGVVGNIIVTSKDEIHPSTLIKNVEFASHGVFLEYRLKPRTKIELYPQ